MTTQTLNPPTPGTAPDATTSVPSAAHVPATGSTPETRLADLLARLADADAIGASRIRAWDRLQERRSA